MSPDNSPDNTDSSTVSSEQPQQLTGTYNPFGAASPELPNTIAPIEPQPITQPAKKSRKKLIIGLIIAAVVVVASAVGVTLFVNNQTTQAKAAASQYRKDVLVHLDAVTNIDNYKDRVAIWRNTAKLKDVQFGASLSKEYKDAVNLKSRYESLITDSYPTILDRYASSDFHPFLVDLQAGLSQRVAAPANTTDDSTLAVSSPLKAKAAVYEVLAIRLKTYVYPEKYRDSQNGAVTALQNMSKSYNSMLSVLDTSKIEKDYIQYTKDLAANISSLSKSMIADGWFTTSKENVTKVGEKVDLMREELK